MLSMMAGRRVGMAAAAVAFLTCLITGRSALAAAADLKRIYDPVVQAVASEHSIDSELVHAVIKVESNYERFAVSDKGALGLMQLMPATARYYGVLNVFDPVQNIEGGVKYLKDLIKLYEGQTHLVLAAYNAGQEAVRKYNGIPPYKETRDYIARVQASYGKERIRIRTRIYKYYDRNGRAVLTNDEILARKMGGRILDDQR